MATVKRSRFVSSSPGSVQRVASPTAPGAVLDNLLLDNIRTYRAVVEGCAASEITGDLGDVDADEH